MAGRSAVLNKRSAGNCIEDRFTSGTDTRTSQPYVLTASSQTGPLTMQELSARVPAPTQEWTERYGAVVAELTHHP